MLVKLNPEQDQIVQLPDNSKCFLLGQAMTGKSTAAAFRLINMLARGIPPETILVLTPQRTLAEPYFKMLNDPLLPAGGQLNIMTLGGLAQRCIYLFWPEVFETAGFKNRQNNPIFLTLESAQYYLAAIVDPLFEKGYFEGLSVDHNRILSQILDNLNKSAISGIPFETISSRLKSAWVGNPSHTIIYDQAQECAALFRNFCLENNLLDYSLQIEVFNRYLKSAPAVNAFLFSKYRHLIFDNVEEDTFVAQETVAGWLPNFDSALLIYDLDGGHRTFLGADPQYGLELQSLCDQSLEFTQDLVPTPDLINFSRTLQAGITHQINSDIDAAELQPAYTLNNYRYFPDMIDGVVNSIVDLIQKGVPPKEIAVLSPFLSDSLRFSLIHGLASFNITARTHRPSRSLREEPPVQCLINLAKLAHPQWGFYLSKSDLRLTLFQSIQGLDLTRADLLASITYRESHSSAGLSSFDLIRPDMQERITHFYGSSFEKIRAWINEYKSGPPLELDVFFSRIFGELLSQPGFGFHDQLDAAASAALLIESTQKFRRDTNNQALQNQVLGKVYITLLEQGLVAALYLQNWQVQAEDAVLICPANTFLMLNRPVSYQFWLDTGSVGWWERLLQPLTHPYVLSRSWPDPAPWTDILEFSTNQANMARLTNGLIRRAKKHIFLITTVYNEQGEEQKGPLIQAVQMILRHTKGKKE